MSDLIRLNNIAKLRAEFKYIWAFLIFMWVLLLLEWVVEFGYIKSRLAKVEDSVHKIEMQYQIHKHKIITGEVYEQPKKKRSVR